MSTPAAPESNESDPAPDYDDVIAYAKAHGQDPYDGTGEYKPDVIAWANDALAREQERGEAS